MNLSISYWLITLKGAVYVAKIPKYIHYCWFGGNPIPNEIKKYINTWKKCMPEYKIIKWSEDNFDINAFQYTKEAYEAKKYAFVSDVARIYALNKMGGIYLDVDVEVIKPLEPLFENFSAVLGAESEGAIGTGFLAFVPEHKICRDLLDYYKNNTFLEKPKMFTNTQLLCRYIKTNYNIDPPNDITRFGDDLIIYPQEYFTAYNGELGINEITDNTVCLHHFVVSWVSPITKWRLRMKMNLKRIIKFI